MAILLDGFPTIISLVNGTTLAEKSLSPPGVTAGDAIDVSTMRNTKWRTKAFKVLLELMEFDVVVAYDPSYYDNIDAAVGVNGLATLTFADDATLGFYGGVLSWEPDEVTNEEEQPTATLTILPTLRHTTGGVETEPAYTAPAPLMEGEGDEEFEDELQLAIQELRSSRESVFNDRKKRRRRAQQNLDDLQEARDRQERQAQRFAEREQQRREDPLGDTMRARRRPSSSRK